MLISARHFTYLGSRLRTTINFRRAGAPIPQFCRYLQFSALPALASLRRKDYSARVFQLERGGKWVKGKSADTFSPLGPFLATADEIPNAGKLAMWLKVNGESRQN